MHVGGERLLAAFAFAGFGAARRAAPRAPGGVHRSL